MAFSKKNLITVSLTKVSLTLFFLLALSCQKMNYSPNAVFRSDTPQDINQKNIEKLLANPSHGDTIRIAIIGDSQNHYDNSSDLVDVLNQVPNIDFMLHTGDLVDFGMLEEFHWMHDIFSRLYMPYITVIGNHDLLNNGEQIFKRMYGPLDFTFIYRGIKFVYHNTNSREYNFDGTVPNLDFLRREMQPEEGVDYIIPVCHVPPFDEDFDTNLEEEYSKIMRESENLLFPIHGHLHGGGIREFYQDDIIYVNTFAPAMRKYKIAEIVNGNWTIKEYDF
ncbi:metallophosphoesterase [Cytophagaceae bacterium ABcell3]|nr:metallophosphoesterase [Cytophagaceae bacterium ABcell3]